MSQSFNSRRSFLHHCAIAASGMTFAKYAGTSELFAAAPKNLKKANIPVICVFTRVFDTLGTDMFSFLSDAGFQGIDLTVRSGGFVAPEKVEKELPAAVRNAQRKGLSVPMIATAIVNGADPLAERILKTAAACGVKYYRTGYYNYDSRLSIDQNLEAFKRNFLSLCELNARYGLQACYQNHVGGAFGGSIWDLWYVIRGIDSRHVGCQYDIRHAVAEGLSTWQSGLKAISPYVENLCIKDFIYENHNGNWGVRSVPLGTGAVDFKAFFDIIRSHQISGLMSMHIEFPLLSREDESQPVKEQMKKMLPLVRKEVDVLKSFL